MVAPTFLVCLPMTLSLPELTNLIEARELKRQAIARMTAELEVMDEKIFSGIKQLRNSLAHIIGPGNFMVEHDLGPTGVIHGCLNKQDPAAFAVHWPPPPAPLEKKTSPFLKNTFFITHNFDADADTEVKKWDRATGEQLRTRVKEVLKELGPLTTRELFEIFQARRWAIPGKAPQNNLSAHLSRSEEFVNTPEGWMNVEVAGGSAPAR